MVRAARLACLVLACIAFLATGCGSDNKKSGGSGGGNSAVSAKAQKSLDQLSTQVLSKGPNGETPAAVKDVTLSNQELQQIKAKGATAALVMHYGGNDWSTAQVNGLKKQFGDMGINVIAVTDANFKPEKQVSDIETVLAKKPNIIVSIPTDPVATAGAYRKAATAGVKLVFMDNIPKGFRPGKDYVSVVSADNYGNGVASADLLAKELGGKGKVGVIFHAADFFVTQQRYAAFKKTIATDYPGIQIVDQKGIAGPDFAGDAEKAASAILTKNPGLDGMWAVWDVPAEGVLAAARANGASKLKVTTVDLGENVAIEMARGGLIKGLGAQRPFDQGSTEAKLAGYGLLGKKAPPYVALNALPVTPSSLMQAWTTVYHQPPPSKVKDAAKK
jgi:ribose transport system substrate-binding protein